jgi:hypothetical protein
MVAPLVRFLIADATVGIWRPFEIGYTRQGLLEVMHRVNGVPLPRRGFHDSPFATGPEKPQRPQWVVGGRSR